MRLTQCSLRTLMSRIPCISSSSGHGLVQRSQPQRQFRLHQGFNSQLRHSLSNLENSLCQSSSIGSHYSSSNINTMSSSKLCTSSSPPRAETKVCRQQH